PPAFRESFPPRPTPGNMLASKPEPFPPPSDAVLTAVPSAKIYRDSVLLQFERRELAREKRIVWLALLRALDEVRKTEPTLFTALYWSQIHHMSGFDASVVDAPSLLRAEQNNFPIALAALLNLHPKSDWSKAAPALVADTAKLLLDWMILGNAELALRLDPRAADSLRTMHAGIAQSLGAKVAARLQQSQALAPGAFARAKHAERARGLDEFNKNMIEIAKQIKDYASDDLQLKYLIQAKQGAIDGLKLQSTASGLVELLKAAPTYRQGYMLHRALLLDMLESYKLKGESASGAAQPFSALPNDTRFNFSFFERVKDRVEFNPEIHRDTMNAKFLERLTKNAGRRVKDIQDLIALGKVLKFDRYENRPVDVTKGAPNHRQLAQPTVGNLIPGTQGLWAWFSQDERAEYLQQMKNDLFNKAPLLGARRLNPDWTLGSKGLKAWEIRSKYHPHFVWEYLAAEHLTPAQIDQLMRLQLTQVADQTRANLNELSGEIHKLGRMAEESLDGVSQTLRTLISLSSQISMNLEAAPAFAVHSQNIKRELLMPGFWRSEWESFMHFTDSAMIYLLVFVVV
ncbi:MAG TPA: hypothetical protein PKC28_16450, partial [Bdellovibrionales bacterium]|nr:hypothetical protein [Bdellovibrionales bacterium]